MLSSSREEKVNEARWIKIVRRFKRLDLNSAMKLSKIPGIKRIFKKIIGVKTGNGSPIPINKSLGPYENQILPLIVLEHFMNKASHIFMMTNCGCRVHHECKDYDHSIGCTWMGEGVLNIKIPPEKGCLATKDEALEEARKAIDSGLVPSMGRLRADSWTLGALPDTGHFMSLCYCCPCCCFLGTVKHATKSIRKIFTKMEGISVEVNEEICAGCGLCTDVCIWGALEVIDKKAIIDQNECRGCGRCERKCPNKAMTITLDDPSSIDALIARIESHVDVT